jgi:arylesterase / paraoxonase
VIFVSLVVIIIAALVFALYHAGQFKTISLNFNGHCIAINNVAGPEDILLHPSGDFAFVSSTPRTADKLAENGNIYQYALDNSATPLKKLTMDWQGAFKPLGISYYEDESGLGTLMVVNRLTQYPQLPNLNRIELFNWQNGVLSHRKTIEGVISPNSIVAVDHDRFYVTNDLAFAEGFLSTVEKVFPLPVSQVQYYDGNSFKTVADGLYLANGIASVNNGTQIIVSETIGKRLSVYDRDAQKGGLSLAETVELDSAPDNIRVDENGVIWVAAHPQLFSLLGHASDLSKNSPSQLLKLAPGVGGKLVPTEVFMDAGDLISGGSVAAVKGTRVLIGAIYLNKFLDCSL